MKSSASTARVVVRLAKVVELVLSELGLTLNQYRALTLIDAGPPPMGEFALRLAMEPPNASALVDGLVARSLVERGRDQADRRRVVLRMTARGRALLDSTEDRCADALARVAAFDSGAGGELMAGLDAWRDALDGVARDLQRRLEQGTLAAPRARSGRRAGNALARRRSGSTVANGRRSKRDGAVRRSIAAVFSGQGG